MILEVPSFSSGRGPDCLVIYGFTCVFFNWTLLSMSLFFSITKDKVCIGNIKTHNNQEMCLLRWGILVYSPNTYFFNGENKDKPRDFAQDPDPPRCQRLRHGAQRLQPGGPRRGRGASCDARNDAVGELGQEGVERLDPIYGEYGLLDHQVIWER